MVSRPWVWHPERSTLFIQSTKSPLSDGHGLTGAANLTIEAFPELRSTLFKARSSIFDWLVNGVSDRKRITYWADGRSDKRTV